MLHAMAKLYTIPSDIFAGDPIVEEGPRSGCLMVRITDTLMVDGIEYSFGFFLQERPGEVRFATCMHTMPDFAGCCLS